ncbi:MAG TPA: Ig-like domain-containing protein [Gemmatimonadaceae bacterium]|nr:Ig-like domain-containing protein [Gemmatimonadaceae bacterium]
MRLSRKFFLFALAAASPLAAQSPEVARIVVSPAKPTMVAGDTLRLSAQALDAAGKPVPGVRIRFQAQGGRFEGTVDTLGLVESGATGTLPVVAVAIIPGARPKVERFEVRMVAGPAASITPSHALLKLALGQRLRLGGQVFSKTNDLRAGDRIAWASSAPNVARVDQDGMVTGAAAGKATLTGKVGDASVKVPVEVVGAQVASLEIFPPRVDARQGDVQRFRVTAKDARGNAIGALSTSWSFSPGEGMIEQDGAFTAYTPGEYVVTAVQGGRTAQAVVHVGAREVRRPLTVVGRLPRMRFTTEEVWIHPNGKVAYLGSGGGGDVMVAIDISDPSKPVITDSIVSNTRRVNDVMTTPDGKFLVFTREGASDRKNGIVICSLEDPLHPKVISEFTEGVTAGVHSAFIFQQAKYGTHIYLTNDGTGALHVIDINDPYKPKEVAQWRTPRTYGDAGRTLHDIDVQNGLLYASYWNDGLVILDVGNGMKGGSPSNPQLVSQYKYDLNFLYRDVEAVGGPGFIRGTHTAWRHKNYVFIADEVFPGEGVKGAKDAAAGRAYGRLQVIDVSDIDKPRSVAYYEPEFGGVHNVWVAGDTLYMGAYNGGFRAFDISGELRGDLRAQGREIGHLNTADMDGRVKNAAMTWGVVVKNGLAYVNDMYNGLWIVRIEPKPQVVP